MQQELQKLVDPTAEPEKITGGFKFAEGPVFSRREYLLFSDIPANRIMKWERGAISVYRENSNGANGLTFDHQGRLLACEKGRVTRTEKDGAITTLAEKGLNTPNDIVYAIDGSIYFTDPPQKRVYQITRKGELRAASEDCDRPNGVALGPNQQKVYVADSGARNVRVYDIKPDGALSSGQIFADLKSDRPGNPDGLKTDEAGNVWVSAAGGIWIFNAKGERVGIIRTPEQSSNCNWGDGFVNLYITARTSVYKLATKSAGTRTY